MGEFGHGVVADPGWAFRIQTGLLMAAGTSLFALGGHLIDRRGLGRGLAVMLALAADWWTELSARWHTAGGADLKTVEVHQDLSDALAAAKLYGLSSPDRPVVICGLRFRSLTYFFGPQVPLVLLGPPDLEPRTHFIGGEVREEAELVREFE